MLFSINRQQLSLFDAYHALLLVCSPLMAQVVLTSIKQLFRFEHYRLKRIQYYPCAIYTFGALLLPLWAGLSLTLRLSSRAFINSKLCSNPTFEDLLSDLLSFTIRKNSSSLLLFTLVFVAPLQLGLLIRKFTQRVAAYPRAQEGTSGPLGRLRILRTFAKCGWCVSGARLTQPLTPCRRTIHYKFGRFIFMASDLYWASVVIRNSYWASGEEYVMSYGQV
jgi:hypothetical protein